MGRWWRAVQLWHVWRLRARASRLFRRANRLLDRADRIAGRDR